ncbi:MAG TPA: 2'-deoxycytidine 5'-triphosphate deaminase [Dehalococcoidia bacterium]|uniref:dUTPase-like domain-containing protein n=1 Tax=marine metagenome TaxID=408172 RepID=A0A382GF12_9ZZZZ|nr:2'-deoxycytidine 5'-triphosphate deaminase [Dehalococcoidia bacterium]HAI99670.1 2'-deoxycytidine 5'-triphosphate deaminase [Dehalococcoidia bacterium]|tara:strand:+ start:3399 stop:4565 length:1167 start_codon:yes stop_codon:yes gene_type:complete
MANAPFESDGIFPDQWLREAVARGFIDSGELKIPESNFQPASLDLRLGPKAYRLRCSFVSDSKTVEEKLDDFVMGEIDLRDGAILERNRPYLIPLIEQLRLPPNVYAKTNPRSSTGRLDIFTRVISDRSTRFDEIAPGYHGKLYLEVASRSFTIHVKERLSLNQLRLITGNYRTSENSARDFHQHTPIIFAGGEPADASYLDGDNGVFLSIDLAGDENRVVGYKAKKNSYLLDLCTIGEHNVEDFWDPVYPEKKNRLVLEPEEFYLLLSAETVRIPPSFAAEMNAYEPTSGELRTHYAGFFDPGFGYDNQGLLLGSKAVLEVRAHDVPFMIENGQKVCQLEFQTMAEAPKVLYGADVGSSYQNQELTLSKHFRRPEPQTPVQFPLDLR